MKRIIADLTGCFLIGLAMGGLFFMLFISYLEGAVK